MLSADVLGSQQLVAQSNAVVEKGGGGVSPNVSDILPDKLVRSAGMRRAESTLTAEEDDQIHPFVLGGGLPPVATWLVGRIWHKEFEDMADLLWDNLEADRRRQGSAGTQNPGTRPCRQEVPDALLSAKCFSTYVAIVTAKLSERVKHLMAYQVTILWEAQQCGGAGQQA